MSSSSVDRSPYTPSDARPETDRLIHFEGRWPSSERQPLVRAIQRYEADQTGLASYGARWVAVAVRLPAETFYIASRHGWTDILRGTTPEDLAAEIRTASRSDARRDKPPAAPR
jgi:hypothetical protein